MTSLPPPLAALAATPAPMDTLRAGLIRRAECEGVLDAAYRYLDTPLGCLFLAASPSGIVRVGFEHEREALARLVQDVGPRVLHAPAGEEPAATSEGAPVRILDRASAELLEYFAGQRQEFTVPVDLHLSGFRGEVVQFLPRIGYGRRASYKELASEVGNPGAVRAVGSACANNPIPILLPCHRVVRSDGTWGNYRGGPAAKMFLLELERSA